ncbi:MAG: hypothetical protein A3I05_06265 [Deltaproteobacteria bacterium RIFCSPLOWO2_02_FULL_44_10]|nr:MAG: hypothetical protein A3C46_00155 [Deltaproteobacteria bacterium RIFCSPHIGHO2_02_FULL_44_16]OGQ45391.1 MAG: hypothetical protein A3I05_06265 [Deltaproteobacteria bacterium RIFCSPLOWO2_02_FULL_44_10]
MKRLFTYTSFIWLCALGIAFGVALQKQSLQWKIDSILHEEAIFLDQMTRNEIAETVFQLSQDYDIDPVLILAMMKVESHFRTSARSHRGAMGLMQVKSIVVEDIADELGIDPSREKELQHNISFNIHVGVHYLTELLTRFHGDLSKALMAYNRGPTSVAKNYGKRGVPYGGYQKKVLETYMQLNSQTQID